MTSPFQTRQASIDDNPKIRAPQKETYQALRKFHASGDASQREVGIVLPVGCGKSGCITLAPFAFQSKRTLVIAPGVSIAEQLAADFNPSNPNMFYQKCQVLEGGPYPEPVEIRGTTTNRADLDESHVVITNIQQLQGDENRWLQGLPSDYFDLILFDEGHHSVAATWEGLKGKFPAAKIVNFSATPERADGQIMAGRVIYSYPIVRAIKEGFVKRLKAVQLNPRTLKYVRREGEAEVEVEVDLAEVKRLGETDADFRRSIVTSKESLATIADASIRELNRLRTETGEQRLKIIASALNFEHCRQIVEAYRARGLRADYVHSKLDGAANRRVMQQLGAHELDVVVQVRKLGEGFDHPFLSVAAVFSIFSNLSPFVQFVGRIMRVIKQNAPDDILNRGVVVFHAGANIARQWSDFQSYSDVDQGYFDQLLPLEGLDPASTESAREFEPILDGENIEVRGQSFVELQEIQLVEPDEAAAIQLLKERGLIPGDFDPSTQMLQPIPTTKVAERQAARSSLDMRVRSAAGQLLGKHGVNAAGRTLDRKFLGRDNSQIIISTIQRHINDHVGRASGERHEMTRTELDSIDSNFGEIVAGAERELFDGN